MKTKIIVISIIGLVVLAGIVFLFFSGSNSEEQASATSTTSSSYDPEIGPCPKKRRKVSRMKSEVTWKAWSKKADEIRNSPGWWAQIVKEAEKRGVSPDSLVEPNARWAVLQSCGLV